MKKITFPIIFSWFFLLGISQVRHGLSQETAIPEQIESLVQQVRQEYVPDSRTGVFEIVFEMSTEKPLLKGKTTHSEAKKQLLEQVRSIVPDIEDRIELFPSSKLGEKIYAVANVSAANLRYKPNFSAEPGLQILLGTPLRVLEHDTWYRVQTPNDYICYVTTSQIVRMTKDEFNAWTRSPKLVFVNHYGFSYEQPDAKSQIVSDLASGCMLKLEGQTGDFYEVSYPDQRKAFVLKTEALPFDNWRQNINLTPESILAKAKSLKGIPYLWAGTTAKGVDCSGLTNLVFFLHGIIIPRDASQQALVGEEIELTDDYRHLKPADLLFFGTQRPDGKFRIVHVGFYISDGDFIHSAGYVRINSLLPEKPNYDEYNTKRLVQVKRILGQVGTPGIDQIHDNPLYKEQP